MSDPISFDSTSPRFGLPLLFSGQAQKEVFVNEAISLLDGLCHCAVEGEITAPPTTSPDGQAWLIAPGATGEWSGKAGQLALRQAGQWLYIHPRDGLRVINLTTGQDLRRLSGVWRAPAAPSAPSGGTVVDTQVRASLAALITALREAGVFAA